MASPGSHPSLLQSLKNVCNLGVTIRNMHKTFMEKFFNLINCISGCAGSSLPHRLFPSCGEWGLLSSCGVRASHHGGFSCFGHSRCTGSVVVVPGLKSTGSVVVAHKLSCP